MPIVTSYIKRGIVAVSSKGETPLIDPRLVVEEIKRMRHCTTKQV